MTKTRSEEFDIELAFLDNAIQNVIDGFQAEHDLKVGDVYELTKATENGLKRIGVIKDIDINTNIRKKSESEPRLILELTICIKGSYLLASGQFSEELHYFHIADNLSKIGEMKNGVFVPKKFKKV